MKRFSKLAVVAASGVAAGMVAVATGAWGAGTIGGDSTVVDPSNVTLTSGGSQTTWTFKLPAPPNDRCSGDSATDGFRVQSYITPVANDPAALTFSASDGPNQPAGSFAAPLFDTAGSPYIAMNTAAVTGQVKDFPGFQFNFARFNVSGAGGAIPLQLGQYNVGIACTGPSGTDKFWNTKLTFVASGSDPSGETWTQAAAGGATTTTVPGATTTTAASGATTTTTRATTTTTIGAGATTTSTTTLGGGSTTSTTRGVSVLGASASSGSSNLPRSGGSVGPQVVLAGLLLYAGALVLTVARRQHWAAKLRAIRR